MELKQIKELMTAMERSGTKRLVLKREQEFELVLEREDQGHSSMYAPQSAPSENDFVENSETRNRAIHTLSRGAEMPARGVAAQEEIDSNQVFITSPMVGTFYLSPSPDDPCFVNVGDKIDKNTVVCVIEAMKVMNEVKAGVSGIVAEILVENAHPVEFGTKLFRIK